MAEARTQAGIIDVLDRVLDKGVVIDAHVRISVIGVELLSMDARVVVASIETYLTHAEAISYTGTAARPLLSGSTTPVEVVPAVPVVEVAPIESADAAAADAPREVEPPAT